MNRILFYCCLFGALPGSPLWAQATDQIVNTGSAPDAQAAESAKLELTKGAAELALLTATSRLTESRLDDAIAMAWAGLEQTDRLPASDERSLFVQSLMQVIIDSRVEKRLASERQTSDTTIRHGSLSPPPVPPNLDPKTGLSTVKPPKNQAPLAEALSRLGEDPELPEKVVIYPDKWKSSPLQRREHSGILYEGLPFENDEGKVVQTIVYDVRSLLLPRPNFQYIPLRDLHSTTQSVADREALRRGSEIFNGYADDVAAGIPLLGYFGGAGNWPATFGDGQRELEELTRMIEEIAGQ